MEDAVCRELDVIGGFSVDYKETPNYFDTIYRYVQKEINSGKKINIEHLMVDALIPVIRTKSKHWLYECEYRVIRHSKGILTVPPEYISEVIVGSKITNEVFSELESILDSPSLKHIEIKKAEFSDNSFTMEINNA